MRVTLRTAVTAAAWMLALLLTLGAGAPAAAAEGPSANPWAPWLGCWELTADRDAVGERMSEGSRRVCLARGAEPASVELTTWVDDEVVMSQQIVADGRPHAVQEAGCEGLETARFSADGDRLLTSAEQSCDGLTVRTSGITLLTASDRWADIQVSEVEDQREVLVRRYRRVGDDRRESGLATLAVRATRQAASAPLDAVDVIEAVAAVDPAAVEAMLMERNEPFPMSSDMLLRLADADVPGNVIDLMVALSYPDYFLVDDGTEEQDRYAYDRGRRYAGGWAPWYAYGYYSPYFAPFGHGYYYRPVRTIFVTDSRFGGKVVKGRGYTRVRPSQQMPSGGLGELFRSGVGSRVGSDGRSSGERSRGAVTPSGHAQGGSRSGTVSGSGRTGSSGGTRKAKPRGGENQEQ